MKESFTFGLAMGLLVGAILVHTSPKAQEIMDKGEKCLEQLKNNVK